MRFIKIMVNRRCVFVREYIFEYSAVFNVCLILSFKWKLIRVFSVYVFALETGRH